MSAFRITINSIDQETHCIMCNKKLKQYDSCIIHAPTERIVCSENCLVNLYKDSYITPKAIDWLNLVSKSLNVGIALLIALIIYKLII